MQDENSLIDQAQAGDPSALNELVTQFWNPVYRFISRKTDSLEDAKEITQDTFVKAVTALPGYRQTGAAYTTYLHRIATNLITDFWRKKGRSPEKLGWDEAIHPAAAGEEPDTRVIDQEQRQAIAAALKELPEEQRRAIELRIIAGLPVREAAVAMGKSDAAVKMLQQRALKNLRELLLTQGIIENQGGR